MTTCFPGGNNVLAQALSSTLSSHDPQRDSNARLGISVNSDQLSGEGPELALQDGYDRTMTVPGRVINFDSPILPDTWPVDNT